MSFLILLVAFVAVTSRLAAPRKLICSGDGRGEMISKSRIPILKVNYLLCALLSVSGLCPWLSAQKADPSEHGPYDLRVPVDLVLVPVSVQDREGRLVASLGQGDFEVAEDGIVQELSYFSVDPSPLSVAFLLDRTIDERAQETPQAQHAVVGGSV